MKMSGVIPGKPKDNVRWYRVLGKIFQVPGTNKNNINRLAKSLTILIIVGLLTFKVDNFSYNNN